MATSRFERLKALLGDDQLPPPFERLSLAEGDPINPSSERRWVFYSDASVLQGGESPHELLESTSEGAFEPHYESQDLPHSSGVQETATYVGRHLWTHDPTKTTRASIGRHSIDVVSGEFNLDARCGQLSAIGELFSPIIVISKLPYKFVDKNVSQLIASAFFDEGKFWMRGWELYYVHPPSSISQKPLILITLQQVRELVSEINHTFVDYKLDFPPEDLRNGLVIRFPDHSNLRPRFLGKSTSKAHFNFLELNVPSAATFLMDHLMPLPDRRSVEVFNHKVQSAIDVIRGKDKASKAKKREERIKKQQNVARSLKRAQRYLGLRPKSQRESFPIESFENWEDEGAAMAKISEQTKLPPADVDHVLPYPFDNTVIFICIDVEVWEKNQHSITEIGVSILDTLDLIGIPPGRNAMNWEPKIHKYHFRITENSHLVNCRYVQGCPDRFEFGQSEFISIKDAPAILTSIFTPPSTLPSHQRAAHYTPPKHAFTSATGERLMPPSRNVVLVGHDVQNDISYLRNLLEDFDPLFPNKGIGASPTSPVIDVLDTAALDQVLSRDLETKKLAVLLSQFKITGWNLHNAGNDAAYTLHVLLAMTLKTAEEKGDVGEESVGAEKGWASDDDDGGAPLPPHETSMEAEKEKGSRIQRELSGGGVSLSQE